MKVKQIAVVDTETTGVDVENDRIVSAFVGLMSSDGEWVEKKSWLINPGVEIPEGATAVHGITNEQVREHGEEAKEAIFFILQKLDIYERRAIPIVAYNAAFDLSLLKYEALRYGWRPVTPDIVIDPFVIDKAMDKYRKGKRTLTVTAANYGIDIGENAHDAEADCLAAGRLALVLLDALEDFSLREIHERQIGHAQTQATSLQKHLRKTDPMAVVDGRWPIR